MTSRLKKIANLFLQYKVVYAYFYVFSLYRTDCEEHDQRDGVEAVHHVEDGFG